MPAKFMNKIILTTQQILDAYEAHGDDFIEIDIDNLRKWKDQAQYIDVNVKLADGKSCPVRYWKLSTEGLIITSRIKAPEQRVYKNIRIGVSLYDEDGEENINCKALQLLCNAYVNKMEQLVADKIITTNPRASKKQPDGTFRPVHLMNSNFVTPMQTSSLDRETQEFVDLENPRFWISMPQKRFFKNNDDRKPSEHFENKYYVDSNGNPDPEKPVMTYEFDPTFYNIDDWYHHPRTGKKLYKKLGDVEEDEGNENIHLDNTNIQNYLTKGSALMGNLKFDVQVCGPQCKLDIRLYGDCFVKHVDTYDEQHTNIDEESLDAFANLHKDAGSKKLDDVEDFADDDNAEF